MIDRVLAKLTGRGFGDLVYRSRRRLRKQLPLAGYTENRTAIRFVDRLSEDDLVALNGILDWHSFVADAHGRRFGNAAWATKRNHAQAIPDRRVALLNQRYNLRDKHVLEIGCFEGIHTLGLLEFTNHVTAVDGRIDNVVKTIVRCAFFGHRPVVFKCDVEAASSEAELPVADVVHHVGVLYHLKDPVRHLRQLGRLAKVALMLDTHYALDHEVTETYVAAGDTYAYKHYREHGTRDPFSGMYDHSKWLRLDDIVRLLGDSGFGRVDIAERRDERNGPRVLLFAEKMAPAA